MFTFSFEERFYSFIEVVEFVSDFGGKEMENALKPYYESDNKLDFGSFQNYCGEMAMVGLDAMQRANSTLEDFVSV